jgi:hypothetical protein
MMKPKNFPERRNRRRKRALERLKRASKPDKRQIKEMQTLQMRIVDTLRGVRTKIRRGQ